MTEGAQWLAEREPRFAHLLKLWGVPPLRRRSDGFADLLHAIVSQQVSAPAAVAIWGRLQSSALTTPESILAAEESALRAAGLSHQKVRYAQALAESGIDFNSLRTLPDEAVITKLIKVPGIGRWTAEIYAMFSLGRCDVFAPGDLALQVASQNLFALGERPSEGQLRRMAQAWSPWRSIAAVMLWVHYSKTLKKPTV